MGRDDLIERLLVDLAERCAQAWCGKGTECSACPCGEMAALAAAALEAFRQQPRSLDAVGGRGGKATVEVQDDGGANEFEHWSVAWQKRLER